MNECRTSSKDGKQSLTQFMKSIRGNRHRLRVIEEKLDWVYVQMLSISSPVYDMVGSPSTVHENRLCELLDKEDELNAKIKQIYEDENLLHRFMNKLTEKETQVLRRIYFKCLTQQDTALDLCVSQQYISQYVTNIEKKWSNLSKLSICQVFYFRSIVKKPL